MTQIQLVALLCLTGAAAFIDARTQRIPNPLIAAGLLVAVVVRIGIAVATLEAPSHRALAGAAIDAIGGAALGLIGCAILPLILYRAGAIGGGDVKLLAVVGALVAVGPGLELTRAAFVVGALFSLARLALSGRIWEWLRAMGTRLKPRFGARGPALLESSSLPPMPFGPAVFVAACYLALSSWKTAPAAPSSNNDASSRGTLSVDG